MKMKSKKPRRIAVERQNGRAIEKAEYRSCRLITPLHHRTGRAIFAPKHRSKLRRVRFFKSLFWKGICYWNKFLFWH